MNITRIISVYSYRRSEKAVTAASVHSQLFILVIFTAKMLRQNVKLPGEAIEKGSLSCGKIVADSTVLPARFSDD